MKKFIILFFVGLLYNHAQTATEVYLFDLVINDSINNYELKNPRNISSNPGFYDNQPSFLLDNTGVLFSSTRNEQTDIALYDIETQGVSWLTHTEGSEYSPEQTPNRKYFSAVRLDKDGQQLLWKYSFSDKKPPKVVIKDLKVGYYTWFNKRTIVSFVLNDPPTLEVSNLRYKIKYPADENIGRSVVNIPHQESIAYISFKQEEPEIYTINPDNVTKKYLADPLKDSQDMAIMPDGTIVMGRENDLFSLKPKMSKGWSKMASLTDFGLSGVSRLAISPDGSKIAIVVNEKIKEEESSEN